MYQMLLDGRNDEAFALLDATDPPGCPEAATQERHPAHDRADDGPPGPALPRHPERQKAEAHLAQLEQDQDAYTRGVNAAMEELGGLGGSWEWAERLGVQWDADFLRRHSDLARAAHMAVQPSLQQLDLAMGPSALAARYRELLGAEIAARYQTLKA